MTPQRPKTRVHLPNGMWVNIFTDATEISINNYNGIFHVVGMMNRDSGGTVYLDTRLVPDQVSTGKSPIIRDDDFVCVPKLVLDQLVRGHSGA